jgi:hypothetical protein
MTGQAPQPAPEPARPGAGAAQPAGDPAPPVSGPVLEVVSGQPSAEELAALTVVLAAALAQRDAARPGRPERDASAWASRSRGLRAPLMPGPDAWRRSARPGQGS